MMTDDFVIQGDVITKRHIWATKFLEHVKNMFWEWYEMVRLEVVQFSMWLEVFDVDFALHPFSLEDVGDAGHIFHSGYWN